MSASTGAARAASSLVGFMPSTGFLPYLGEEACTRLPSSMWAPARA